LEHLLAVIAENLNSELGTDCFDDFKHLFGSMSE
jgi:hypothetical protein